MASQVAAEEIADRLGLQRHQERLDRLCRQCNVARLDVFGSATTSGFDPTTSDLDFLVAFKEMKPATYAKAYFNLREGLVDLFQRPVDLVTDAGLKNPHFMKRIETERLNLYVS